MYKGGRVYVWVNEGEEGVHVRRREGICMGQ